MLHIIPGADFGFREGNQKWPEYYADSLPAVTNIGLGCPTGVKFDSTGFPIASVEDVKSSDASNAAYNPLRAA